jgi:hypothetical protein
MAGTGNSNRGGAPFGNANSFVHGLTVIGRRRREGRLPRGRDKQFKLELLNSLIEDAGGAEHITAAKRLLAEIIARDALTVVQMDRAIQRMFRLNPKYRENIAAQSKLDAYRRPIINSLSSNLDRFGFDRAVRQPQNVEDLWTKPEEGEEKPE